MGLGRHGHGSGGGVTATGPYRALAAHYTVGRTIGEGTFGKVRKGVHRLTRAKVAIKILEKRRIKDADDVERVSREIHIMKHMKHPNIINLFEVLDTKRFVFLIMEYAAGGELFDFIVRNTRVNERLATEFFHHIINGIDFCHKANVIHRDLKPENLLLDANLNIKIVDFGLGNVETPDGVLTTACGSPCYAPPEMIQGRPYVGSRADIWSAGVILYALLCGYLPFEDSNTSVLYKKICQGRYDIPDWISLSARDLIARLLQTDPDKRLTIDDIRLHPWYLQTACSTDPGQPFSKIEYGNRSEPVVEDIIEEMKHLGYDTGATVHSVLNQLHDHRHATYQLLLYRYRTLGESARMKPPCNHDGEPTKRAVRPPLQNNSGEEAQPALPSGDVAKQTGAQLQSRLRLYDEAAPSNGSVTHRSRGDHPAYNDGSITARRHPAGVSIKFDKDILFESCSYKNKRHFDVKSVTTPRKEHGERSATAAGITPLTLDNIDLALELAITPSRTAISARTAGGRARPSTQTPRSHRRAPNQPLYEGLAPQSPVAKIYAQPTPRRVSRITVKGTSATPRPAPPSATPGTPRRTTSARRTPVPPPGPPPTRPRTPRTFRSGRRSIPTSWRV